MKYHKCTCMFVPPDVIENLAKAGIKGALLSAKQSEIKRVKRKEKEVDWNIFIGAKAVESAERKVYDSQNTWNKRVKLVRGEDEPSTNDDIVNKVYNYSGIVRDYLKNKLNRNSIDDAGMDLILNVHYGVEYMNAFWDGDEMTFGDGDGKVFVNFAESLDVVAHELAHGVTQFTANLVYEGQSGALNEHFSDVFGQVITQYANQQDALSADWLIGDEIMGPELYGEALRSMKAPGSAYDNKIMGKDPQPDHMRDYYKGPKDNGGVHINSGIFNKVFYLVSIAIGTDKAVLIWYDALQKLWPTAEFNDAYEIIVNSARFLTKEKKVPVGTPQTVRAAFKDVGLPL